MSKVYVKLVNKCNDCPNIFFYMFRAWEYHAQCKAANYKTIKDVEAIVDEVEIPEWCPLETGKAIEIINSCKTCEYICADDNNPQKLWCQFNKKIIPNDKVDDIPDWCLLKIKEDNNETSSSS